MKLKTFLKLLLVLTLIGAIVAGVIYYLNRDNFEDDFQDFFDEDEFLNSEYVEVAKEPTEDLAEKPHDKVDELAE